MPQFDGTGPRGEGMFTGRAEGYCSLRLPEPGSGEPAVGYAGIQGRPVQLAPGSEQPTMSGGAVLQTPMPNRPLRQGRRYRCRNFKCRRSESLDWRLQPVLWPSKPQTAPAKASSPDTFGIPDAGAAGVGARAGGRQERCDAPPCLEGARRSGQRCAILRHADCDTPVLDIKLA